MSFPSGPRTEIRGPGTNSFPAGCVIGPDGTPNQTSEHNMKTGAAWFYPAFLLARFTSVASYVGQETLNGQTVQHVTAWQQFPNLDPQSAAFSQQLSQTEIFLDASTLLPVAFRFNTHPDNNALLDLPIEIRLSDYRAVNGVQIPFRIQKFLNYSLILEVQLQSAASNTGLSSTAFTVPAA